MPITLNNTTYSDLIRKDIEWLLEKTERSLERDHIIDVLKESERNFNAR